MVQPIWKKTIVLLLVLLEACNLAFADDDHEDVTCGSAIKLTHVQSGIGKYLLFSEGGKQLNVGSGQQLVTWVKEQPESQKSLWWVRPMNPREDGEDNREYHPLPEGMKGKSKIHSCTEPGEPIRCGSWIRLTHLQTGRNLHSHNVRSALSNQQEVSAYGQGDGKGDRGDNWEVVCSTGTWRRNKTVKLRHADTKAYLGASRDAEFNRKTCGNNCPLMDHLEAFGRKNVDGLSDLQVDLGIHIYN